MKIEKKRGKNQTLKENQEKRWKKKSDVKGKIGKKSDVKGTEEKKHFKSSSFAS